MSRTRLGDGVLSGLAYSSLINTLPSLTGFTEPVVASDSLDSFQNSWLPLSYRPLFAWPCETRDSWITIHSFHESNPCAKGSWYLSHSKLIFLTSRHVFSPKLLRVVSGGPACSAMMPVRFFLFGTSYMKMGGKDLILPPKEIVSSGQRLKIELCIQQASMQCSEIPVAQNNLTGSQ